MWRVFSVLMLGAMCCGSVEAAEKLYRESERVDDLSGEASYSVALVGEDGKSMLVLGVRKGKQPVLTLAPDATIFPDDSDIKNKRMGVGVTMRSTAMPEPVKRTWQMLWMDYKAAHLVLPTELAKQVFAGESVTFGFDKTGKRFRFRTEGDGTEGLSDAIANVLKHAVTQEEADKQRVDELLKQQEKDKESAARRESRLAQLKKENEEAAMRPVRANGEKAGKELAAKLGVALRRLSADDIIERGAKAADKIGFKDKDDPRRAAYVDGFVAAMNEAKESR